MDDKEHQGAMAVKGLQGEVAIVTGASRGLGRAAAIDLARAGAVTVVTSRSLEACQETVAEIRSAGGEAFARACDIADQGSAEELISEVVGDHGDLSILINNAGVIEPIALTGEGDPDAWQRLIQINLVGCYNAIRFSLPYFSRKGRGVIVNISSGAAHKPMEGWSAYCTSKAGLAMLTRCTAQEYGESGVRSYGFLPGVVDTEMQVKIRASGVNEVSRIPRENLLGADRPARVITRLCEERPEDLNGEDLSIRDREFLERLGLGELHGG